MSCWVFNYYAIFAYFVSLLCSSREVYSFIAPTTFGKHTSKTFHAYQENTRAGVHLFLQKASNQTLNECKIEDILFGMEKLHKRLHASGVTDHFFVNDEDGTNQLAPSKLDSQELLRLERGGIKDISAVHVKTLVWKGTYLQSSLSSTEGTSQFIQEQNKTFYFVTALRVQDKVELKFLRNIIKNEFPNQKGTLIIQMAEREVAEDLTGFTSGSMPPGWHKVPSKLFIDDYILEEANMTNPGTRTEGNKNNLDGDEVSLRMMEDFSSWSGDFSKVILSVGSGSADFSLHVSLKSLLESSYTVESKNGDITLEKERRKERLICSFTKTRANERYKQYQRTHSLKDKNQSGQKNPTMEKVADGKITRRLFQHTSRKKGKVAEVKDMITHIGDEYPSYMSVVDTKSENGKYTSEVNKNALHYAAWKGDLETVTLLVNTGRMFPETKDLVNVISTGEGNYGKTAIFYSITQCRDGKFQVDVDT